MGKKFRFRVSSRREMPPVPKTDRIDAADAECPIAVILGQQKAMRRPPALQSSICLTSFPAEFRHDFPTRAGLRRTTASPDSLAELVPTACYYPVEPRKIFPWP